MINLREDASYKSVSGGFDEYSSSGSENGKAAVSLHRLGCGEASLAKNADLSKSQMSSGYSLAVRV